MFRDLIKLEKHRIKIKTIKFLPRDNDQKSR